MVLGLSWYRCPVTPLYFFLVHAQLPLPLLPLRVSAPFPGEFAGLTPVCRSAPGVWLEGTCCVLFLRACSVRCFPCCWFLGVFWSLGVCASASLVTWVRLQPFPSFSGLLLLRFLAGVVGVLHLVRVLQLWCDLLGLQVGFPCCLSLTLEWVCFWPMVSQVFVGCEGSLSCPSWFVIFFLCLLVLHLFWGWGGLVTGRWPLLRLLVLDSSDARLHRPDALASVCYATPISGHWMVLAPALSWALPWVLPSRFQCWLLA